VVPVDLVEVPSFGGMSTSILCPFQTTEMEVVGAFETLIPMWNYEESHPKRP
jgi:hypothetical protein